MLVKLDACFNPTPSPSFYFDFNGPFVRCHSYTLLMVSGECILRMRLRQLFMKVWTFLVVFLAVLHVSDTYGRTDLTLDLKILILVSLPKRKVGFFTKKRVIPEFFTKSVF